MKLRSFLLISLLLTATASYADLSVANKWRIEQAMNGCKASDNKLQYPEYWQDAVTEENRETLCMADQFATLAVMDGDEWLKEKAGLLIQQCRKQSKKDTQAYYLCLQGNLEQETMTLSSPCKELGAAELWDEKICRQLISYIFIKKFETVFEVNRPLKDRVMSLFDRFDHIPLLNKFINPVFAIIFLMLYVLDMALFIDPGNWMGVSKFGFFIGLAILGSYFTTGGLNLVLSGCIMVLLLLKVIWGHVNLDAIPTGNRNKSKPRKKRC